MSLQKPGPAIPMPPEVGRLDVDVATVDEWLATVARFIASQVSPQISFGDRQDSSEFGLDLMQQIESTHALVHAWAVTHDAECRPRLEQLVDQLASALTRGYRLAFGHTVAYVTDVSGRVQLGANALAILALVRWCEATGERRHLLLLEQLAGGLVCMQDAQSGRFDHVLGAGDLQVVQAFDGIAHDGQAILALLRLYELTGDARWMAAAEQGLTYCMALRHWRRHSHWLASAVNVLTRHRPLEAYFRFGIAHLAGGLRAVGAGRPTPPEGLELAVCARQLADRLATVPALQHLGRTLDGDEITDALNEHARRLLQRSAMTPAPVSAHAPQDALADTVTLDLTADAGDGSSLCDAARALMACVALRSLLGSDANARATTSRGLDNVPGIPKSALSRPGAAPAAPREGNWTALQMQSATQGRWLVQPTEGWWSSGPALQPEQARASRVAVLKAGHDGVGIPHAALGRMAWTPVALMTTDASLVTPDLAHLPILIVPDTASAVRRMGMHARSRFFGDVIGVTGSVGKTTLVDMLSQALQPLGMAGHSQHGTSLPMNVAADMACMPQDASSWVIEIGSENLLANVQLARPTVAMITGAAASGADDDAVQEHQARKLRAIFSEMRLGGRVVLRRDMPYYAVLERAALARGLSVISYGEHAEADVSLLVAGNGQVRALVQGEELVFQLAAPGRHMAVNALGVLAALMALELPLDAALQQFAYMQPLPGRGQRFQMLVQDGGQATVIDDTASANPESMRAALALLAQAQCAPSQRVAVLGDMLELGAEATRRHLDLERELLQAGVGRVMLYGLQMKALHERLRHHTASQWFETLAELDQALESGLHTGDWVLVKSSAAMGFQGVVERLRRYA